MEVSLSVSCPPASALFSSGSLCNSPHSSSSSRFYSARSSHIKQHALQSRKCGGLGYQVHSSRIAMRASASLPLVSDVFCAAATLILLSSSYSVSCRRKRNVLLEQVFSKYYLFKLVANFLARVIDGWIVAIGDLVKLTFKEGNSMYLGSLGEICDALENVKAFIQLQKSGLARERPLIVKASESHVLCSDEISSEKYVSIRRSAGHLVGRCGFLIKGPRQVEFNDLLPMSTTKSTNAPFMLNISHSKLSDCNCRHHSCCDKNEITSFRDYARVGIYCCDEMKQPVELSPSDLHGPKKVSYYNSVSSLVGFTTRKEASLLSNNSFNTTDHISGEVSLSSWCGGPFGKQNELGNTRGFAKKSGKIFLNQRSHSNMAPVPSLKGVLSNDQQMSLKQFKSSYKTLLKVGRLNDCIELLEAMDKVDLLDMNEVYHTEFFNICKSQKAVREAFRFTKLIQNPSLSTFNMLMSVCASAHDFEGAFQVLNLLQLAGLKMDCRLYTTLISTCAKSGKVDAMFEVFHEMINNKVEPNVNTYGSLIDGCARAGQVAKAFGAYGMMRHKKVKPDRVVFNALITACGKVGAVDRAFDVLAEMRAENLQIDPDHVTIGALMRACTNAGQIDRAQEVYKMIHKYNIKGTPEVYTIALNSCSQCGDWEFACSIYNDMTSKGVVPDEIFLSALIDVAGHAGMVDAAFSVLDEAKMNGLHVGGVSYSSLMGACCNAKSWEKAMELYRGIKSLNSKMTVSAMNALITALCDADQLQKALDVFPEMKGIGLCPNNITYSVLLVACERKDDLEAGLFLLSQAREDGVAPNLIMCQCLIGLCLQRFKKACGQGEAVLSFNSGRPQLDNKWTSTALMVYRETIVAGVVPNTEVLTQLLGCLQLPRDFCLKSRLIENLGIHSNTSKYWNLCSFVDGFGEYDPRALSLFEEAASLGIVPCVSLKQSPIVVDARNLQVHISEVCLLTVLKGLKHRLAAGARLPNITIFLPVQKVQIQSGKDVQKINISGRVNQAIGALLRRLGMPFRGSESSGKIRVGGASVRRWFQPKFDPPGAELGSTQSRLGKGISYQQRDIRAGNLRCDGDGV